MTSNPISIEKPAEVQASGWKQKFKTWLGINDLEDLELSMGRTAAVIYLMVALLLVIQAGMDLDLIGEADTLLFEFAGVFIIGALFLFIYPWFKRFHIARYIYLIVSFLLIGYLSLNTGGHASHFILLYLPLAIWSALFLNRILIMAMNIVTVASVYYLYYMIDMSLIPSMRVIMIALSVVVTSSIVAYLIGQLNLTIAGKDLAYTELGEYAVTMRRFNEVLSEVRGVLDIDEAYSKVFQELAKLMKVDNCYLYLLEGTTMKLVAGLNVDPEILMNVHIDLDSPDSEVCMVSDVLRTGKLTYFEDFEEKDQIDPLILDRHPFRSAGCIPLSYGQEKLGVLFVTCQVSRAFTDRDLKIIDLIASELARAVVMSRTYEELKHLKEIFENIIDNANDMIITTNSAGLIQIVNPATMEMTGFDLEQLKGTPIWDHLSSDRDEEVKGYIDQTLRGIKTMPMEFMFKTKSGDVLIMEMTSSKMNDTSGEGVQLVGRNITDRKKLLEEIVKHNSKLIALNRISGSLNQIAAGENTFNQMLLSVIGALDMDFGALYQVNDAYDRISMDSHFGFKEKFAEEIGVNFISSALTRSFVTKEEILLYYGTQLFDNVGVKVDSACENATFLFVHIFARTRLIGIILLGSYKHLPLEGIDFDLLKNVGNQLGAQIINNKLLEELKSSEAKYRMTIENAADGIFIADESGAFLDVNNKMLEITGYSRYDLLRMKFSDLTTKSTGLDLFDKLKSAGLFSGEFRLLQNSGSVLETEIHGRAQDHQGERAYQGIIRDITEKKELARLLERENEELKMLNEVFGVSTQSLELKTVAATFSKKVADFFHNGFFAIYLYNESAMALELAYQSGAAPNSERLIERVAIKGSIAGQVFLTRAPILIEKDLSSDDRIGNYLKEVAQQMGMQAMYTYPVMSLQKPIGVVQLGFMQQTILSDADNKVISLICRRLGSMIENSMLYEHERSRSLELETIDGLTKVAFSTLNLNEMLRRILDRLIELTGAELGAVLLKDAGSNYLHVKVGQGLSEEIYVSIEGKIGEGICGIAFNTGEIMTVDQRNKYEFLQISDYGFKTQIAIPLISRTDPLGVIYLASRKDITISEDIKRLLKQISDNVAMTVHNALLFAGQKESTEKLKLFNKIAAEIGTSFDLQTIFHHASQSIVGNLDVGCAHIWKISTCDRQDNCRLENICSDQGKCLHLVVQNGTSCAIENNFDRVPLGKFDIGIVAVTKRSVINNNPQENPLSIDQAWVKREGFKSFAAYPIIVDDQVTGVLDIYNFFQIDKEIDEVMLFIAKDLAVAVKNANLFNELNYEKTKVDAIMKDLADGVVITSEDEKIFTFNNGASSILGYKEKDVAGKYCWDVFKGVNEEGNAICKKDCFPIKKIRQGADEVKFDMKITDAQGDQKWIRSNLSAQRDEKGKILSLIRVFQDVTETKELEILALVDELTKLKNRRYLMSRLKEELASVKRNHFSLAFAMIDIDKFKSVNDTYGHPIGDEVLKSVARTIQDVARTTDIVARFGGEEFCLLLPYTSLDGARIFAEKIRSQVEQNVLFIDNFEIKSTISIGLATTDNINIKTGKHLIEDADKALYEAKETGRNRVCATETEAKKTK